jgi:hypothetical protein
MRKVMRHMTQLYANALTQLYANALAAAGLRTTQYAIIQELQRQADAAPIAALQFVEVAARSARLPA